MDTSFFTPSEQTIKFRRNLLLAATFLFIHIAYFPLSQLQVLSVQLPSDLLGVLLPGSVIWLALNYFYYLYAEYTLWRSEFFHLAKLPTPRPNLPGDDAIKHYGRMTVVPEINVLNKNIQFQGTLHYSTEIRPNKLPDDYCRETEDYLKRIHYEFINSIAADAERIMEFRRAIWRFNLANRLRLMLLDIAVPGLLSVASLTLHFCQLARS